MIYMLDTNICIYLMKGTFPNLGKKLSPYIKNNLCISVMTVGELEYGVKRSAQIQKNALALYNFLKQIPIVEYDIEAIHHYADIRAHLMNKGTPIGEIDMLIAAQARSLGYTIITRNVREFSRVPGLEVVNWVDE